MKDSHKKTIQIGFTLIELLVVIAIIGLLSSVVLASLSGARESARDARRKQDLRQLQTALELYYNDHGRYLINDEECDQFGPIKAPDEGEDYSTVECLRREGYLSANIGDPSAPGRIYYIASEEHSYTLWASLESPSEEDLETLQSCPLDSWDNWDNWSGRDTGAEMNYCVGQ